MANVKSIIAAHLSQRQRSINKQVERETLLDQDRLLCNIIRVSGDINVPDRPGFVWCQEYSPSDDTSPFHTFNDKVQAREGLSVWVGPGLGGRREVLDWNNATIVNTVDYNAQKYLPLHHSDHEWPDFKPGPDVVSVYPRSLSMLRTYRGEAGALTISASSLRYVKGNALVLFPGKNSLDISGSQPASGLARFVGIYLDPDDNTLKSVDGATTSDSPAITPDSPTFPESAILSANVRLDGDQTTISEVDIVDTRQILDSSGSIDGTRVSKLVSPDGSIDPVLSVDNNGDIGAGVTPSAVAKFRLLDASGPQLRLEFDATHFVDLEVDTNHDFTLKPSSTGQIMLLPTVAGTGPKLLLNETANANMTIGITIDQGTNADEILNFRSADVGPVINIVETGTWFAMENITNAVGGANLSGFHDADGPSQSGFIFSGYTAQNLGTSKNSSSTGVFELRGFETDGTNIVDSTTDGNIVVMRTERSGATRTVWVLDEGGNVHIEGDLVNLSDGNTKLEFGTDKITLIAGGLDMITMIEAGTDIITINDGQNDIDLRVESANQGNMLYMNAGADEVAIGHTGIGGTTFSVRPIDANDVGITIRAVASQVANIQEWLDDGGNLVGFFGVGRDAATNAVTDMLMVGHNSTATPAAGYGTGLKFELASSTSGGQDAARISALWTTATHATRASALTFETLTNAGALTEQMRIDDVGVITSVSGRIKNTTRIDDGDSPYTVLVTDEIIVADTDGGVITVNLPVGIDGTHYRITNVGTSANDVTVDPNGAEELFGGGAGVSFALVDGETINIYYETTEGWW